MITIKYKDIQHLIPEDCIYDGFDNEIVIYHNGDYTTENPIDLDFGDKLDPDYSCKELPFTETFGSEKTLQNPV